MSQEVELHILKRYELVKKVGSGAYGHVWKAKDKKTNQTVALKKIFDAFQHSTDAQRTFREITLLHEMDHPNVIKLLNVYRAQNDKDIYLVFQFMQADLHNVISQRILQDIHNRFILYQILKAIKYLHSAQLIHRDLKPSNVLLNSDCQLKVCDFGLVRCLAADRQGDEIVLTQQVATRWYRAPEVLLGSRSYNKAADMWSIGCILAQMLLFKPLFPGNSTLNQLQRILNFTNKPTNEDIYSLQSQVAVTMIQSVKIIKPKPLRDIFTSSVPQDAVDLVSKLLIFNPQKRLTVTEALKHPYLTQFHNKKEEIVSPKIIRPPISDNKKLTLKEYRNILYDQIKKFYREENPQTTISYKIQQSQPSTPKKKPDNITNSKQKKSFYAQSSGYNSVTNVTNNMNVYNNHSNSNNNLSSSKNKTPKNTILVKTALKEKQQQVRNLIQMEKQKLEKKVTGVIERRKQSVDIIKGYPMYKTIKQYNKYEKQNNTIGNKQSLKMRFQ